MSSLRVTVRVLPGDVLIWQIVNMKTVIFDTIAGVLGWVDFNMFLR